MNIMQLNGPFAFAAALFACGTSASPVPSISIGNGFTDGKIGAAGFPDPLAQYGAVTPKSGSGGGSTGGGFAGFANSSVGISDGVGDGGLGTMLSISGTAFHHRFDGFTAALTRSALTLELTRATDFKITNNSTTNSPTGIVAINPVTFSGPPGSIYETSPGVGTLSAGTYTIRYGIGAGHVNSFGPTEVSEWYSQFGSDAIEGTAADWKMLLTPAPTQSYEIGGWPPSTVYYVQGQSFTPSVLGNLGTSTLPLARPALVRLNLFAFEYDPGSEPLDYLYIYESPPTPEAAATGAGSIAKGEHVGDGTYRFERAFLNYNTKYYAVLQHAAGLVDGPGDVYTGGVDMFIRSDLSPVVIGEGYGGFDCAFAAQFAYVAGCPGDFNFDGFVDDSDFQQFVLAYNLLLCADSAMPANCPANLNSDLGVDDEDFVLFVRAYNELICP